MEDHPQLGRLCPETGPLSTQPGDHRQQPKVASAWSPKYPGLLHCRHAFLSCFVPNGTLQTAATALSSLSVSPLNPAAWSQSPSSSSRHYVI